MIRLTPLGKIIYQHLGQIVGLLMLYAIVSLLSAIQALPIVTIVHQLPSTFISIVADRILNLILLTGFVTGSLMMSIDLMLDVRLVTRLYQAWTALIVVTLLLCGLDIAAVLDIVTAVALFGYLGLTVSIRQPSHFLMVWTVGIVLIISSLLAQWVVTDSWQIVVYLFRIQIAYMVTSVSIMFWLMTRWSNVRADWARDGVIIVAGCVALAGFFITIAPLHRSPFLSIIAVLIVPICYMILGGHSYRALRDRNQNQSLSPHWIAIAVLFWLAGAGFLGTLSTHFGFQQWLQGTRLAGAQHSLMLWGVLAVILSLTNYTATTLRGENRRVTGYMPLWLMAFGTGFGMIVRGCAGVVEVYLRNILLLDTVTVDALLIPLSLVWIICLLIVALGIMIYAIGFWIRRPIIHVVA